MEMPEKQRLSYISNPRNRPYSYDTIIDVLVRRAEEYPDKEIFVKRDIDGYREAITYNELKKKSIKFARFLISKGIKKGDHIALFGPNTIEIVIAQFAIIMAGAVAVNMTMSIKDGSDVWNIFFETECKCFLIDPGRKMELREAMLQLLKFLHETRTPTSNDDDSSPFIALLRGIEDDHNYPTLQTVLESGEMRITLPTLYSEDVIAIFTTSGSTGKPKIIPHTHFSFVNIPLPDEWGVNDSILYNDRPFAWLGGSPLTTIMLGETRVFTDASVTIAGKHTEKIWNIIKSEKCMSAILMPYFLGDLISKKDDYKDSFKLEVAMTGGQMVESFYTQVTGIFADSLLVGYASTETMTGAAGKPLKEGDSMETGYIGNLLAGMEMKLIGDDGQITPVGQPGEICIRSSIMFNGYFKNEEATKAAFLPGNWFRTGDLGILKSDGSIIIKGRIKQIISRGTRKVVPDAIEDVILQMQGIFQAAVVNVPDKRLHEEVCACFVTKENSNVLEEDVEEFCSNKMLRKETLDGLGDIPSYYLKFDSFPCLLNGKVDKLSIRLAAIEKLTLNSLEFQTHVN